MLFLSSCDKEKATPELKAEATLSRSLVYDPALSTKPPFVASYSTDDTRASARIIPQSPRAVEFLQIGIRAEGVNEIDSLLLGIPTPKLKPGWVGTYTLNSPGNADGGAIYTFIRKRLQWSHYAVFTPGTLTITAYNATTRRVSGTYSLAEPDVLDPTDISSTYGPLVTDVSGDLTLTGSFSQVPIAP